MIGNVKYGMSVTIYDKSGMLQRTPMICFLNTKNRNILSYCINERKNRDPTIDLRVIWPMSK